MRPPPQMRGNLLLEWDSSSVVSKAQPAQGTRIDPLDVSEGRRALFTRPVRLDQGSGYLLGWVGCGRSPTGLRLPTCLGSPALLLCLSPDSQLVCRPLAPHPGLALAGGRGIRPGNWISERVESLSSLAIWSKSSHLPRQFPSLK